MEGMSSTDMEVLKKQREELLLKKQAKERVLAELIPENVEVLKQQRELILAKKAEKERQLVELMNKQEIVSNRAIGGTLSKSNSKKRGRSKRDEEDELATTKQSTLSTSSSLFNTETKFILDDKQFDELRKEHKRNRKLIREQYQEFEVLTQYTLNRVDFLQQSLNLIMNHLGLVPAPTQPEPVKADDNIQKEDINIEIEVHNPSPAISSLTTQHTQIESVPTESLAVPIIEVIEAHTTDMIVESTPVIKTTDNLAHEQNHLEHQHQQELQQEPTENNNNNNNNNNNSDNYNNNNNFNTNNSNNSNNDTFNYNNNDNNMMEVVKERAHSESSGSDNNNNNNNSNGQEDKYMNDEENKKMMRFNNESKQENGIRNNCHNESFSATSTTEYTNDQHHF